MQPTTDAAAVKRALYQQNTTLKAWCEERGYSYRTALNAVQRHAGGHAREPWGPKTRQILTDLGQTIGQNLIPK